MNKDVIQEEATLSKIKIYICNRYECKTGAGRELDVTVIHKLYQCV